MVSRGRSDRDWLASTLHPRATRLRKNTNRAYEHQPTNRTEEQNSRQRQRREAPVSEAKVDAREGERKESKEDEEASADAVRANDALL